MDRPFLHARLKVEFTYFPYYHYILSLVYYTGSLFPLKKFSKTSLRSSCNFQYLSVDRCTIIMGAMVPFNLKIGLLATLDLMKTACIHPKYVVLHL